MKRLVSGTVTAAGLAAVLATGIVGMHPVSLNAAAQAKESKREAHPLIRQSIRQLEGIKDRLQKAPRDFGGHRAAAVEAIDKAISELHQAEAFDKK